MQQQRMKMEQKQDVSHTQAGWHKCVVFVVLVVAQAKVLPIDELKPGNLYALG